MDKHERGAELCIHQEMGGAEPWYRKRQREMEWNFCIQS